jgi:hypothetical protein
MTGEVEPSVVTVDPRFCGPPGFGNGGYSCGLCAASITGPASVTLRKPVPLEEPLRIVREDSHATAYDRVGEVVARAEAAEPLAGIEPPRRPGIAEAEAASPSSPFRTERHPYPGCFVCGPRHPGGLHIHVGELEGEPTAFAAAFTIETELAERDAARPEIVWASLDCPSYVPSYWAGPPVLLGRLTAERLEPVPAGQPLVALSWPLGIEGRKLHAASAILDAEGRMLARARALWIRLKQPLDPKAAGAG